MIAKLALYSLLSAEITFATPRQAFLFADEFQTLATENIKVVFQQARSKGISIIAANQTMTDLQTRHVDLVNTVTDNTHVRIILSADNPRVEDELIKASGETMYLLRQWTYSDQGTSTTFREELGPRLQRNDLRRLSADPNHGIVIVKANKGLAQYDGFHFPVRFDFHISYNEFKKRQAEPWPDPDDKTFVVAAVRQATPAAPSPKAQPLHPTSPPVMAASSSGNPAFQARLRQIHDDQKKRRASTP
jgi:hypothetical protein